MTIRADLHERISGKRILGKRFSAMPCAIAVGLAPLAALALAAGSSGLLATPAHASPCPETRVEVLRAVRAQSSMDANPMPEITVTDQHVFSLGSGGVQCGPYDRVTGFQLMRSPTTPITMPMVHYRAVHTNAEGERVEVGFGPATASGAPTNGGFTDVFDERDPRGRWQAARYDGSKPEEQYFRLSLALAEGAQPEPAVTQADEADSVATGPGETDQQDEPDSGQAGAQAPAAGVGAGTGGALGTGTGGLAGAESGAEADEELAISDEPAIADNVDIGQTGPDLAGVPGLPTTPDLATGPILDNLLPSIDPQDTSQFIPDGDEENVSALDGSGGEEKLLDLVGAGPMGDHPQMQPLTSTVLGEIAFGPMQTSPGGYFSAPTTAPVGSMVPIDIHYGERATFDNIILVRQDLDDNSVRGSEGRNLFRIFDEERAYRRAGDKPGVYELRLRRQEAQEYRIIARQQIELVDIDIDLQVPDAVTPRQEFEVYMNPVMDGHLVIRFPHRADDDVVNAGARSRNAIEAVEGPGVFTRAAPREVGEYEVRFHFNPPRRFRDERNLHGRLMARATLNVVSRDEIEEAAPEELAEDLAGLEAQIAELSENIEQVTLAQTQDLREAIAALGLPALALLTELLSREEVAPQLAFALTTPLPPAQWSGNAAAPAPAAAQPPAPAPASASASPPAPAGALSAQDERRVIMLIARLDGVVPEEQQPIIDELATYGPAASDLLLDMMQEGLINRALALRAAAAIEADGETPQMQAQPAQPAPAQQVSQPRAAQPSAYQVTGVAPDDMLNVRDRPGVRGSTVVGRLAPDARRVLRSGPVEDVGGRDWWHVRHPTLPPQGGWVNSRFLAAQTGLAPEELSYRVTGVAADDALNIRSFPGTDGEIIARIPPHASGLRWNGESAAVAGGTWWELVHPDLPGGTGWVNARFLEAEDGVAVTSHAPPQLGGLAPPFTEAEGYAAMEADQTLNRLLDSLPQTSSIFPPGNELNPLTKAILVLENEEGVADHARFAIRYGMEGRSDGTGGPPVPYSFVEIDRYNLGAVFREAIAQSFGEARTPPPESFGAGAHVSYRMEFRPIQGRTADLVAISRRVIPDDEARATHCLTLPCLDVASAGEDAMPWREGEGPQTAFERPYEDIRNGVYTPAAMADLLMLANGAARIHDGALRWSGFEESESLQSGEPFLELVMDVNLAQDFGVEAVSWYGHLMDDSVAAIWQRAITFPSGEAGPQLFTERAFECARGEPGREGLCP